MRAGADRLPLCASKKQKNAPTRAHPLGAKTVHFNHLFDPVSLVRDNVVKQGLQDAGIAVHTYNADLLFEPWNVLGDDGKAFSTYDAFWERCLKSEAPPSPLPAPASLTPAPGLADLDGESVEELGLEEPAEAPSNAVLSQRWTPGEESAMKRFMQFIGAEGHLGKMDRAMLRRVVVDDGDTPSTSCLSAFLHYGEISARDVWQGLQGAHVSEVARAAWARQLGFREYSRYLTFHYPFTRERSLLENLRALPWCHDQNLFKAWRQGRTGYPIVDAGMRELNATGWIHNSIRVLCASFLVKYLLLPWQWGLKYFWDSLLDADIESDVLGWQYIAGCLPDGVPFDELPDPHAEGLKLDPQGRYVRRWVPELSRLPSECIHRPSETDCPTLEAAGVELGVTYPLPVSDETTARERVNNALEHVRSVIASGNTSEPVPYTANPIGSIDVDSANNNTGGVAGANDSGAAVNQPGAQGVASGGTTGAAVARSEGQGQEQPQPVAQQQGRRQQRVMQPPAAVEGSSLSDVLVPQVEVEASVPVLSRGAAAAATVQHGKNRLGEGAGSGAEGSGGAKDGRAARSDLAALQSGARDAMDGVAPLMTAPEGVAGNSSDSAKDAGDEPPAPKKQKVGGQHGTAPATVQ